MNATPAILVSSAGLAVAAIGLFGVVAPEALRRLLNDWRVVTSLPVTVLLRLLFGCSFLLVAYDCRLPALVRLIGVLELAGAALLLVSGSRRLALFVQWWLERPSAFVRSWCLGASGLGVLLLYAGA